MDLAPLEISPEEAAEALRHYEAQLAEERTAEDEAIASGYRAAARGLQVIVLPDVIAAGGWFHDSGLPRLAIARADTRQCFLRIRSGSGTRDLIYGDAPWPDVRARVGRHGAVVTVPWQPVAGYVAPYSPRTVVPPVPPQHRPTKRRLPKFHILWEVERWDETPPVDPALPRQIRGDLWAVVATWDLTPLERAVLAARSAP
jgi:hypothetical protein